MFYSPLILLRKEKIDEGSHIYIYIVIIHQATDDKVKLLSLWDQISRQIHKSCIYSSE